VKSIQRLLDLSGRTALVAGGAGHLGTAACEALAELGCRVAVLDRLEAASRAGAKALGRRAFGIGCDLTDAEETAAAARAAIGRLGGLDILIHTAAFTGDSKRPGWAEPFAKQSAEAFANSLSVNLTSAFVLTRECRTALAKHPGGAILLVASTHGLVGPDPALYKGTKMQSPMGYGASKGGLLQLTRHLATTLAPRIRVNAISPGGIARRQPTVFVSRYKSRTPLNRMAREEDFKGAVAYLCSAASAYVTGHNLVVDGGYTAW